jgi:hypothetical protein
MRLLAQLATYISLTGSLFFLPQGLQRVTPEQE